MTHRHGRSTAALLATLLLLAPGGAWAALLQFGANDHGLSSSPGDESGYSLWFDLELPPPDPPLVLPPPPPPLWEPPPPPELPEGSPGSQSALAPDLVVVVQSWDFLQLEVVSGPGSFVLQKASSSDAYVDFRTLEPNRKIVVVDKDVEPDTGYAYRLQEITEAGRVTRKLVLTRTVVRSEPKPWRPEESATGQDADRDGIDDGMEEELMRRFAPRVYFHHDETHYPSSVPWYLQGAELWVTKYCAEYGGESVLVQVPVESERLARAPLDLETLTSTEQPRERLVKGCYTAASFSGYRENASGNPIRTTFFTRTPGSAVCGGRSCLGGSLSNLVVYTHVRPAPSHHPGMIDIQYWIFYPKNGDLENSLDPSDPDLGGFLASHEGDWEHVTVRVAKGEPPRLYTPIEPMIYDIHSMYFAGHGGGHWTSFPARRADGRPSVYVSRESHASYAWAGTHDRGSLPEDHTSSNGAIVETRGHVKRVGERHHLEPGMKFMEFSGSWGGDLRLKDIGVASPHGPLLSSKWIADPAADDDPIYHRWLFYSVQTGRDRPPGNGDRYRKVGSWDFPLRDFDAEQLNSDVSPGGSVWLAPGSYDGRGHYTTPVTLGTAPAKSWDYWTRSNHVELPDPTAPVLLGR